MNESLILLVGCLIALGITSVLISIFQQEAIESLPECKCKEPKKKVVVRIEIDGQQYIYTGYCLTCMHQVISYKFNEMRSKCQYDSEK